MIGKVLSGRYRIEEQVGSGGMAVVYRARDMETGGIVALKLLRPEYQKDEEFVQRFSREAEAAAKMSHENIVNMLDVGMDGDMRYIVMEHIDGPTLKDVIRRRGCIPEEEVVPMALRMLAAIDHAHRNGIVHRDIKPRNILIDPSGTLKIADFGIARLKTSRQKEGTAIGSVHYISPEQARGEQADEQSDLYSAGVVLYEMLTGEVPFDGKKTFDIVLKHASENPRSMRELNDDISVALDEVVMRALCKDRYMRYKSAAEMASDLRETITRPEGGFVRYPKPAVGAAGGEGPEDAGSGDGGSEGRKPGSKKRGADTADRSRLKKYLIRAGIAFGAFMLIGALVLGIRYLAVSVRMIDVTGRPAEEAVEAVEALGLKVDLLSAYSEDVPAGDILLQSRRGGEHVMRDVRITLTKSLGSQWYQLEDMTGWEQSAAAALLEEAGVATVTREYVQSDAKKNSVVGQSVEAGWVSRDTPVTLYISGQSVAVPSLLGMTEAAARAVVEAEGLKIGLVTEESAADALGGTVIEQSVEAGERVLTGTSLDLKICAPQETSYAPLSPLTVCVPLDGLPVRIVLTPPSGEAFTAYEGSMAAGMGSVALQSPEVGRHRVDIYEDGILYESLEIDFE